MTTPDLTQYDVISISSSAGKDSQAMLDYVHALAVQQGVTDRLVVVHADLGRMEWQGTCELAAEQAAFYQVPFIMVSRMGGVATRSGKTYQAGEVYGDLLDYTERRGAWPSSAARFCTSEFKRGPIVKEFTAMANRWREATGETRACNILDCMGMRADESPARKKKPPLQRRTKECTSRKEITTWLPIHSWTEEQVWERIHASGVPYHPAYDLGMPRLSCVFCIMADRSTLEIAGRANPELLREYVALEQRINHTFKRDLSLADVLASIEADLP